MQKEIRRIGFLGAGAMATALINGLLTSKISSPEFIEVYDISQDRMKLLAGKGCGCASSAQELVEHSDVVVIAVKPQNIDSLLPDIANVLNSDKLIVSIAAGVSIKKLKRLADNETLKVVRVMPNAPMLLLEGAAVIATEPPTTDEDLKYVRDMFGSCGETHIVAESDINATIGIHSSSPALIFLFAKAVAEYAKGEGIDEKMALNLVSQALIGSAAMMKRTDMSCDHLIAMITSPNGTTEAMLKELAKNHFYESIISAMHACTKRAEELGK